MRNDEQPNRISPAVTAIDLSEKRISIKRVILTLLTGGLILVVVWNYNTISYYYNIAEALVGSDFELFLLAGFIAQMIDGALGMAYGVSASTFLLSFGVSPAAASASIHTSEIFTSGVSGLMHLRFQNVNKKLFKTLLLPGVLGAALGALVLSYLEQYNDYIKPVIALYTLYLGIVIIRKALGTQKKKIKTRHIPKLATFGGFMDSIGGGGWGPIVSSTLIAGGRHPRYTIGSVNLTEFFVALASSLTFFSIIGIKHWNVIAGLILGGVIAAPIGAYASKRIPVKLMMLIVGIVVILISFRIIFKTFY
ncbi:sulfite exporter TauE/SafE family protein [Chryseosolibacter indicus]|uniref:Probable membrane transporter protein n=1 Tax=Chryseosolibacter indicus TaxID=2782351 RepID=A0ABS5VR50_9BACT|nr:sulfite exporter TauE/SafE family protein [Chryseosolibacter indicus]MBT1703929.1 sulfite exporter TauE/SafE family protein [Chryseosolibacter indicus]